MQRNPYLYKMVGMVEGLKRYQKMGHLHFVTFCCYRRQSHLEGAIARDLFEDALERIRRRYEFLVTGYVVMPEHIHLLVSEPAKESLAVGLQALKLSVARRTGTGRFWQARYYDFNVFYGSQVFGEAGLHALEPCETRLGRENGAVAMVQPPLLRHR